MSDKRSFTEMFRFMQDKEKFLVVGLDSRLHDIPTEFRDRYRSRSYETRFMFNNHIIAQTRDIVCAYMADDAFYRADADALCETVKIIHATAPEVPFILGSYAGGVERSNEALAEYAFDYIKADAITVSPYFGREGGLQTFLDFKDKGVIVSCRTSNRGVEDFQDRISAQEDVPLWKTVAWRVSEYWNSNHNCALLMGPTSHGELSQLRELVRDMSVFVTGIGKESKSGRIEDDEVREIAVNGKNRCGQGFAICSSRGVILAPNPRAEAERLNNLANAYRKES
jgi:orotidine 5'-phosphate decarboxylase subfamily 2